MLLSFERCSKRRDTVSKFRVVLDQIIGHIRFDQIQSPFHQHLLSEAANQFLVGLRLIQIRNHSFTVQHRAA